MKHLAYYVIRPRNQLASRAQELGQLWEEFSSPVLWINHQGGRTTTLSIDHVAAIKVLFVIQFRAAARSAGNKEFSGISATPETFDHWWDLDVFRTHDDFAADVRDELAREGELDELSPEDLAGLNRFIE